MHGLSVCPVCSEKYQKNLEALKSRIDTSYGKLPSDEYGNLLRSLSEMEGHEEDLYSVRETCNTGIREGEYYLRYQAKCKECGWKYEKSIDEKVY
jgi:hypothetical protein